MTGPTSPPVLLDRRGAVAVLTLNRPERLNGWTGEMEVQYFDHLAALSEDESVRAVVVTGAGRAFCAGADMADLDAISTGTVTLGRGGRPKTFPLSVPKPVVAAVNGACAGIGLVQALMCDVRMAVPEAKITTSFSRVGLVAEHGTSWLLPRHVGIGNALDLLMSGRTVNGEEALRMGLVQRVSATVLDDAVAYADELAQRASPRAMAAIKAQVYRHLTVELDAALEESDELMHRTLGEPDFAEGVAAFQERRPPRFGGLAAPPHPPTGQAPGVATVGD